MLVVNSNSQLGGVGNGLAASIPASVLNGGVEEEKEKTGTGVRQRREDGGGGREVKFDIGPAQKGEIGDLEANGRLPTEPNGAGMGVVGLHACGERKEQKVSILNF